jgi:hypothetical protein
MAIYFAQNRNNNWSLTNPDKRTSSKIKLSTNKKLYLLIPLIALLFASCTKRDYYYPGGGTSEADWVRTHDHGVVAYVDYATGNYIVDTHNGFAVVELWASIAPVEYDDVYAYFSSIGTQTIYNLNDRTFSEGRVIDTWLSWSDAMYIIDDLKYNGY